jgi:hypothetical protein
MALRRDQWELMMDLIYVALPIAYIGMLFALVSLANRSRERCNDLEVDYCETLVLGRSGKYVDRMQNLRKQAGKQAGLDFVLCYVGGFTVALISIPLVAGVFLIGEHSIFFLVVFEFTIVISLLFLGYCWKRERHQLDWHCDQQL